MEKDFNFKKTFLVAMIASLSISALIGIFIILFGSFSVSQKVLHTTFYLAGFSLTGLCCLVLYKKGKYAVFPLLGIAISVLGFLISLLGTWEFVVFGLQLLAEVTYWGKSMLTLIILAFSSAQACLLLLIDPAKPSVKYSLFTTLSFIGIVALIFSLLNFEVVDDSEKALRVLWVFIVLDVLGTIVTPILNKVYLMKN